MSKILVVDDDPSVLSAFEQMLSEQGHLVRVAVRGEEALELLAKERPDLVIMDIRMPGISGLEAVRRIRALDPRLPVIIMTGYATTDTAIEATKLGAVDYHLKPIDGAEILRTIDTALERSRLMNRRVELDAAAGSGAKRTRPPRRRRDHQRAKPAAASVPNAPPMAPRRHPPPSAPSVCSAAPTSSSLCGNRIRPPLRARSSGS